MTTLGTAALNVAKQLGRVNSAGDTITDLGDEIREEIRNAIRHYNRQPWHLTETRLIRFTTVAGTSWYGEGEAGATLPSGASIGVVAGDIVVIEVEQTLNFRDVLNIDYIRHRGAQAAANASGGNTVSLGGNLAVIPSQSGEGEEGAYSSTDDQLRLVPYRDFERLFEGGAVGGVPYAYTRYGGQIGIYPQPQAAYVIEFSATVKAQVPTTDVQSSIWFEQANELIEAAAAGRVCAKFLRDLDRAQIFAAIAQPLEAQLHQEYVRKSRTGRIKAHG